MVVLASSGSFYFEITSTAGIVKHGGAYLFYFSHFFSIFYMGDAKNFSVLDILKAKNVQLGKGLIAS